MDRGNDDVELGEAVVRKIEAAVGQNVDLGTIQDPRRPGTGIDRRDLGGPLIKSLRCQSLGDQQRLCMVGHHQVAVTALPGSPRHDGDLIAAVTPVAVGMQIAAKIPLLDQLGQRSLRGQLDLATALPQLRRYPGAPDGGIDLLFGLAGDFRAVFLEDAIFVDLELAPALRAAAQLNVVGLGPGEVLPGGAKAFRLHGAQVDLHPRTDADGRLGAALRDHLIDLR